MKGIFTLMNTQIGTDDSLVTYGLMVTVSPELSSAEMNEVEKSKLYITFFV